MSGPIQTNTIPKNFSDYNYNGDDYIDFIEVIAKLNGITQKEFDEKVIGKDKNGYDLTYRNILDLGIAAERDPEQRPSYIGALNLIKPNDELIAKYIDFTNQLHGQKFLMATAKAKVKETTRGIGSDDEKAKEITPYNVFNPTVLKRLNDEKLGGFKITLTAQTLGNISKQTLDTTKDGNVSILELLASYKPGPNTYLLVLQKQGETNAAYQRRLELAKQKADKANYFYVMSPDEFRYYSITAPIFINSQDYELRTLASHPGRWTISQAEWASYGPR